MKMIVKLLILSSLFFLGSTALAKTGNRVTKTKKVSKKVTKKTMAHQCAVYKKNATKARRLYSRNKHTAQKLGKQLIHLSKDQQRMPANVKLAKQVVGNTIEKLKVTQKHSVVNSLKYLEKHIQYAKAAKRTCAHNQSKPVKRYYHERDTSNLLKIASH